MEIISWKSARTPKQLVVKEYEVLTKLFNGHLEKHIEQVKLKHPPELYAPEAYILSLGGKRLRPLLALISCDLFDKDPSLALNSALAVELFHNFSLIHDDILDQAPLRRNMPTVHSRWNLNIAILSGDVMLVKAFQVLQGYSPSEFISLSSLLTITSIEVCEGQQMDMNFETSENVTPENYIKMISLKTASLLGCSLKMGGITAGAKAKDLENLYLFGKHLGISFQLLDDLLDAFSDPSKFGKQPGGDIIADKKTFLMLKAAELSDEKQKAKLTALKNEKDLSVKVNGTLAVYRELELETLCREEASRHTTLALQYLEKINATDHKKILLKNFAMQLLSRQV
jgi:geranylgeranyl diphosphate synthase, type II